MSSVDLDVAAVIDILRAEGSDIADIEAKRALGGYPEDLAPTLSAFGNMPGGGVIVLGLNEQDGFAVSGVYDASDVQRRLAAQARDAVVPPLQVAFESVEIEERPVVVARVRELPSAHKPCEVTSTGRAYLRSYDGDYELSEQERAAFVAERGTTRYDRDAVDETAPDDLDPALTTTYLTTCRSRSPRLAAMDDEAILLHTRVLAPGGELTLGGLYALGSYPQRYVPTLSVSARVARRPGDPPGTRSTDISHFDGPLPDLLDQALTWVRRNTSTRVRFGEDGHGRDEPAYPVEAVRELVANALVHRDLGPHALGDRVHLVLEADRLVVTNPGGLFGLTVAQLGARLGGSARNQSLYDIVKDVRTTDGRRIIEGVGTGIAAAREALHAAGMTPPHFLDAGVRFTAVVPEAALLDPDDIAWVAALPGIHGASDAQRHALVAMRHGRELTNRTFRELFPMDSTQARTALVDLVERGLAEPHGVRGGRTYRLRADAIPSGGGAPGAGGTLFDDLVEDEADANEPGPTRHAPAVLAAIRGGSVSARAIRASTGLTQRQVAYALRKLQGVRDTIYHLASRPTGTPSDQSG